MMISLDETHYNMIKIQKIYSIYSALSFDYAKSERFCNWKIEVKLTHLKIYIYIKFYVLMRIFLSL